MKRKGSKGTDGAGLAREAALLHRALAPGNPPKTSVYRVIIQAKLAYRMIAGAPLSPTDESGANDLAAAAMECALRLGGDPGPIRRLSLGLLRDLATVITEDHLKKMLDVIQEILSSRRDEDAEGVTFGAAAAVIAVLLSTVQVGQPEASKAILTLLSKTKRRIRNEAALACAEILATMSTIDGKLLDKVVDYVIANREEPGEGVPLLCLLCATINPSRVSPQSLAKVAAKGMFSHNRNERRLWTVAAATCYGSVGARKAAANVSSVVSSKNDQDADLNDGEAEAEALRIALRMCIKHEAEEQPLLVATLVQYADQQLGLVAEAVLTISLGVFDQSSGDISRSAEGFVDGLVTDQTNSKLQDLIVISLNVVVNENGTSAMGPVGMGVSARLIAHILRRVGVGSLSGSRLESVLELVSVVRSSENDYARQSAVLLCSAVAYANPHLLEKLITENLEGMRVADLSLSTAKMGEEKDDIPRDFVEVLGHAATLAALTAERGLALGVPQALVGRCCDDAVALLRVHPAAEHTAYSKSVAWGRRRVGWTLLAFFAQAQLLREKQLVQLPALLRADLLADLPPLEPKFYKLQILQGALRAAALSCINESISAGYTLAGVEDVLGAAARRLAVHADARTLASSDQQRLLSERLYRSEAPRFFRSVSLCPPSGCFGDICYYLAVVQLGYSQRRSIADPDPLLPLAPLLTIEGTTHFSDASLLGFASMAIPSLMIKEPGKREGLLNVLVEIGDISPSICATVALHASNKRELTSTRMLARIQSVLRRVIQMQGGLETCNIFDLPVEVRTVASAFVELGRVGGSVLCTRLVAAVAGIAKAHIDGSFNIAVASMVVLAELERLRGELGYEGCAEAVDVVLLAAESGNPQLCLCGARIIYSHNEFVARRAERILSELLNTLVRPLPSDSLVFIPPAKLGATEALMEQCGDAEAYATCVVEVLLATRRFPQFPLSPSAFESAREAVSELAGWRLPQKARIRAAALRALETLWNLMVDQNGDEEPLTLASFCFCELTPDALWKVLNESLSFAGEGEAASVREYALRCVEQLRRGMTEARLVIALPELPEALFLCLDAEPGNYRALSELAALCKSDSSRRCAYWLRLCRAIVCNEPRESSRAARVSGSQLETWDANGFCRACAVLLARITLESVHEVNMSEDRAPSPSWLETSVTIVQKVCSGQEGNVLASVQGLHIIRQLFTMYTSEELELKSAQMFASLSFMFAPEQPPDVAAAAALTTAQLATMVSGEKLFHAKLVARFHSIESFRRDFQYDRLEESRGAEATIALVRAAARLVCGAVEGGLKDVLAELRPSLAKISTVLQAVAGDTVAVYAAHSGEREAIFAQGTSMTVAGGDAANFLMNAAADIVVAAIYLVPLGLHDEELEWCNARSPGVWTRRNRGDRLTSILARFLVHLCAQSEEAGDVATARRNRCLNGLAFILKRLQSELGSEDVEHVLRFMYATSATRPRFMELVESSLIDGSVELPLSTLERFVLLTRQRRLSDSSLKALTRAAEACTDADKRASMLRATLHCAARDADAITAETLVTFAATACKVAPPEDVDGLFHWALSRGDAKGMAAAVAIAMETRDDLYLQKAFGDLHGRLERDRSATSILYDAALQDLVARSLCQTMTRAGSDAAVEVAVDFWSLLCLRGLRRNDNFGKLCLKIIIMTHNAAPDGPVRGSIASILFAVLVQHICYGDSAAVPVAAEAAIRVASTDVDAFRELIGFVDATRRAHVEETLRATAKQRKM